MLVDASNAPSLAMTGRIGYRPTYTWTYYSLRPHSPHPGAPGVRGGDDDDGGSGGGGGGGGRNVRAAWGAGAPVARLDPSIYSHYVEAWRWFEAGAGALCDDAASGRMVAVMPAPGPGGRIDMRAGRAEGAEMIPTVSVTAVPKPAAGSKGAELCAVIYPGSNEAHVTNMIGYVADVAARSGCRSASVFSPDAGLPRCEGLERRLEFCLIEKMVVAPV